jgi:adenylate cyclase
LSGLFGALISGSHFGKTLEENFGLAFLFKLRGARTAPDNLAILAIEKKSATFFQLKQQPYKWPRTIHAQAVALLSSLGAAAIGFDLFFEETRSAEDDEAFAQAIQRSGNVVLLQRLTKGADFSDPVTNNSAALPFISEQLLPVVPILAEHAAALAPFPLPQTPVKLNQAWLFKDGAGDKATLPTMMFALFRPAIWAKFIKLLRQDSTSLQNTSPALLAQSVGPERLDIVVQQLRSFFLSDPTLAPRLMSLVAKEVDQAATSPGEQQLLDSMFRLFSGSSSLIINYYGPPGTIPTVPYYTVLENSPAKANPDLQGKAVFIGLNHEAEMAEKDGFYTTFSDAEGRHISGVEVAATIFANLIDGSIINPVPFIGAAALIFFMAVTIGTISQTLTPVVGGIIGLVLCCIYLTIAYFLFTVRYLWPPLIVPVMLQAPLTYLAVTIYNQKQLRREKKNIASALRCYIPESIVSELAQDFSQIIRKRDEVHGICLYSDLENYTVLSENTDQSELTQLINRYYEEMFRIVKRYSGMILDIRGDSMLALWPNDAASPVPVEQSCRAALAISAVFNKPDSPLQYNLPTRIGLHQGSISLGNIGALDHFQYTITGDTVNTVARIESFNKQLKTRLLVSETIAENTTDMVCRKMGNFLFVGKKKPLTIYELIGAKDAVSEQQTRLGACFAEGLAYFEEARWQEASRMFAQCSTLDPNYGPSLWFQQLCHRYRLHMKADCWDGIIHLEQK